MKHTLLLLLVSTGLHGYIEEEYPLGNDAQDQPQVEVNATNEAERVHHCNNPACPHYSKEDSTPKPNDRQLQQLAVATLATMAQSILAIGMDPHNPTNVAQNVTAIVGNFANFVAQAMGDKSIDIHELLENEEFLAICKKILINNAVISKKIHS